MGESHSEREPNFGEKEGVTNKEICFISVVFILCKALRYLFARLLTEGKTLFFSRKRGIRTGASGGKGGLYSEGSTMRRVRASKKSP